MDLEQNYQRLHLFPLSQLSCTYMRVEEALHKRRGERSQMRLQWRKCRSGLGGCNVRGNVWMATHAVRQLAL